MDLFNGFYKGKKILVTGDSGFKGSWLAIWLLKLGAKVYGYSLPAIRDIDNFVQTGLADHMEHLDSDIRDYDNLFLYVNKIKPDIIFHLAAQPLVLTSYEDPRYTFETNVMGTVNLLEATRNIGSIQAVVNITTDKVYENKDWVWGYRESDRLGGKDPYSASKSCSEWITKSYIESFFKDKNECQLATARAGNVIGAGDWAEFRIVPDFFRAVSIKSELVIRNPRSTRPWQHVLEPLYGYLLLAKIMTDAPEKYSGSWNFGPDPNEDHSVLQLIERLQKLTQFTKVKITDVTGGKKESNLLKLDCSKAKNSLGWKASLNFDETVNITAEGYLSDLNNQNALKQRIGTIIKFTKEVEIQNKKNNCAK